MLVNMKDMLNKAKEGQYGVGFFNAVNMEMALAVIETAEELKSPANSHMGEAPRTQIF